jgi:hypothetical protein
LPFKKSLEHVVLRNPLARIRNSLYNLYRMRQPYCCLFQSDHRTSVEDKMKIRSTILALGIAATLTGCQNMDSNGLLSSGAEAFRPIP